MTNNLNSIGLEHLMKAASALTEMTEGDSKSIRTKQEERVPISDDDTASASVAASSSTVLTSNSANTSSTNSTTATTSSASVNSGGNRDKPTSTVAPLPNSRDIFPQRLMRILSDKDVHHIITWLPHGRAFVIVEPEELAEKVLPKHFPESCTGGNQKCKYPSFTRKLNRWGFRQVTRGPDAGAFHHGLFLRDAPQLCLQMICQRTRRRNDKNHVVYQEQQQLQSQYGNDTLLHENYVPPMHNPTLLKNNPMNNSINSHANTTSTTATASSGSSTATTANMTNNNNSHHHQFYHMNHGGSMSFPHLQGYSHHPLYGLLPNMVATNSVGGGGANTSVNDNTSNSASVVHGNHTNPTGMNPSQRGLSTSSFYPTQNHPQQHRSHLHNATNMPSLMHITPTLSSSSSANINTNSNNLMSAVSLGASGNPAHLAATMTMTNNNSSNSNVMTNPHSSNGTALGISAATAPTAQTLNQKNPPNLNENHDISNIPSDGTNTNTTTTLPNAESVHNPTPVVLATSTANTDANATNTVNVVNTTAATSSSSATSTTDDNPNTGKKHESNEERIANAKNMLYDAYLKALG